MKDIVKRLTNLNNYKSRINNHFINSPLDLLLLLALDHHHLAHLLLGVDLIQDLLPQLLQNGLFIQDEVMLAI